MEYKRIKYPDGQVSAEIVTKLGQKDTSRIIEFDGWLLITERINSYEDLMFVGSLVDAVKNYSDKPISLFIPCLLGQRSDRRFLTTGSFDLSVIAKVLNSFEIEKINIFDAHSEIATALINNSVIVSPTHIVKKVINDLTPHIEDNNIVLVSPDAGAYKKVFSYGEALNLPTVAAVKYRDSKGNITLNFTGEVADKNCLIVDDLCDGGYTFVLLSRKLIEQGVRNIFLYVSHGYFSKGFNPLKEASITHIFCTNSVKEIKDPYVTQYNIL